MLSLTCVIPLSGFDTTVVRVGKKLLNPSREQNLGTNLRRQQLPYNLRFEPAQAAVVSLIRSLGYFSSHRVCGSCVACFAKQLPSLASAERRAGCFAEHLRFLAFVERRPDRGKQISTATP